ncbi:MAG: hypothetical protein AB8H47_19030 [Bacteroidia bacterium]
MPLLSLANANRIALPPDSSLSNLFQLDEEVVYLSVSDLSRLEDYVKSQGEVNLDQLQLDNHPLVQNLQFSTEHSTFLEPPLGIPSFVWGFCLGFIGMAVVYFVTEEKEEVMQAFYGCLVSSTVSLVINVILTLNQ